MVQTDEQREGKLRVLRDIQEGYPFLNHVVVGEDSLSGPMISRGPASEVLAQVAELGHSGNFPADIPLEAVGAALWRICMNAQDAGEGLEKIVHGWMVADRFSRNHL